MATSQIKIFTTTFLTANRQHKNDKSIMVEVSKMKSSKQSNIQINAYRMYQVAVFSDISNQMEEQLILISLKEINPFLTLNIQMT